MTDTAIIAVIVFAFGLVLGSFLNVVIYRLPRDQSIVKPRSHCINCDHQLTAWENIPLLSYLILRGRCHQCKTHISIRYPFVEALMGILLVLSFYRYGFTWDFFFFSAFIAIVLVITFIDLDFQIIPNELLLIALIPGFYPLVRDGFAQGSVYLFGLLGLGLAFYLIAKLGTLVFKKESMGMGDVKYAALIGLLLGWPGGLVATALAFLLAALILAILMPLGRVGFGQRIPFGPFLSIGTLLTIFWGSEIITWYLHLVY